MSETSNIQKDYYNKARAKRFEWLLNKPSALVGTNLYMEFHMPNRIIFEKISTFCKHDFSTLRILDLGCGEGQNACYLASLGAKMTAIDISEMNINITRLRAERNSLSNKMKIEVASCTDTGLPACSFDVIVGYGLIHHLTMDEELLLYKEVARLLNPSGFAVFSEFLNNSPFLEFLRTLVPIRGKSDPRPSRLSKDWDYYIANDVHPIRVNTTKHYREVFEQFKFKSVKLEELGVLTRLDRLTANKNFKRRIHDFDYKIFPMIPFHSKLARSIIVTLYK